MDSTSKILLIATPPVGILLLVGFLYMNGKAHQSIEYQLLISVPSNTKYRECLENRLLSRNDHVKKKVSETESSLELGCKPKMTKKYTITEYEFNDSIIRRGSAYVAHWDEDNLMKIAINWQRHYDRQEGSMNEPGILWVTNVANSFTTCFDTPLQYRVSCENISNCVENFVPTESSSSK